jgi:hypothetical protein
MEQEQPCQDIKLRTLQGEFLGWSYRFSPPMVSHAQWSNEAWITYIGNNWFKVSQTG